MGYAAWSVGVLQGRDGLLTCNPRRKRVGAAEKAEPVKMMVEKDIQAAKYVERRAAK